MSMDDVIDASAMQAVLTAGGVKVMPWQDRLIMTTDNTLPPFGFPAGYQPQMSEPAMSKRDVEKLLEEKYKEPPREVHTTISSLHTRVELASRLLHAAEAATSSWDSAYSAKFLGVDSEKHWDPHIHYPLLLAKYAFLLADAILHQSKEPPCTFPT